jgi:hemoglobin
MISFRAFLPFMFPLARKGEMRNAARVAQKRKSRPAWNPHDDWEGSESRLRDFLLFRLAGDPKYILERGHPRLRMRHMPFRIGMAERDRWLALMGAAMDEAEVEGAAREFLDALFLQIADFMRNQPEAAP